MNDYIEDDFTRFQCRHIFTDGHRCGSPSLRNEPFCYHHHTTRRPIANPQARKARLGTCTLNLDLTDRGAIQQSIAEVLDAIAHNNMDSRRAGLILYGLQTASFNLPKPTAEDTISPVEEIVDDPTLGLIAPITEYNEPREDEGYAERLLRELGGCDDEGPFDFNASEDPSHPRSSVILSEAQPAKPKDPDTAHPTPTAQPVSTTNAGCPTHDKPSVMGGPQQTPTFPQHPLHQCVRRCSCLSCCHPGRTCGRSTCSLLTVRCSLLLPPSDKLEPHGFLHLRQARQRTRHNRTTATARPLRPHEAGGHAHA